MSFFSKKPKHEHAYIAYEEYKTKSRAGVVYTHYRQILHLLKHPDGEPNRAQRRMKQFNRRYAINGTIQKRNVPAF